MLCYKPMTVWKDIDNTITFTYKPSIISEIEIPCGQCIGCRLNHAEGWAIRQIHESQLHEENSFITLTYSEDHIPKNNSLKYKDATDFIKRLRRVLDKTNYKKKLKYYLVGEYGDINDRPHYHILLFGFDFSTNIIYKGIQNEKIHWRSKDDRRYYTSNLLSTLWDLGHAEIGDVDYATCMYVSKYVTKKVTGKLAPSHYNGREPEKAQMSRGYTCRKTGKKLTFPIGHDWLKQYYTDIYPSDSCVHNAKHYKIPKAYDNWLEENHPLLLEQVKCERETNTLKQNKSQLDLTKEHEVKLIYLDKTKREKDATAPILDSDWKTLEYMKRLKVENHHKQKEKQCPNYSPSTIQKLNTTSNHSTTVTKKKLLDPSLQKSITVTPWFHNIPKTTPYSK